MNEQITSMKREFLDQVIEIESQSFEDPWPLSAFAAELENKWSWFRVIGSLKESLERPLELNGFIICWMLEGDLHLLNLAVHPKSRRQGLARTLLHYSLDEFRKHGGGMVSLEVRQSNQAAQQLYLSSGFKVVGRRPQYYRRNNEDALVMVRRIEALGTWVSKIGN